MLEIMATSSPIIITGEDNQGQNIVAMLWIEAALKNRMVAFHNGCSNRGLRITESALSSDERLAELMRIVPEESTFILADADCIPAITLPAGETYPEWLTTAKAMRHTVILTTVRGREHRLGAAIMDPESCHIQVEAAPHIPGIFSTWASGEWRERLPVTRTWNDNDTVLRWAKLTNGLYETPPRPQNELIISLPKTPIVLADMEDAVRSTETLMPKHPANSFLLTRIVKLNRNRQMRITEILEMVWLESVNKSRDEEVAVRMVEEACQKWGIDLDNIRLNPKTTYPDGWAEIDNNLVNLEVTKVQPQWPSSATFGKLTAGTRAGKEAVPSQGPVIKCSSRKCGLQKVPHISDVHILPEHDESHVWTCTYPQGMVSPDWSGDLTALPELRIDPEQFRTAIERAVTGKDKLARCSGDGKQNWLVLIIEGFPPVGWVATELSNMDWQSLDAVFAIISDEFGSAIQGFYPDDDRQIAMLKCPQRNDHLCYHPGFVMEARKGDGSLDALREQGRCRGLTQQITASDGTVLAENEIEPPEPVSYLDTQRGIRAALKSLPYTPTHSNTMAV